MASSSNNPITDITPEEPNILPEGRRLPLMVSGVWINTDFPTSGFVGEPLEPTLTVTIHPINFDKSWKILENSKAYAYLCAGTPQRPNSLPDECVEAQGGKMEHVEVPGYVYRYVSKYVWDPAMPLIIRNSGSFYYWVEIWAPVDGTAIHKKIVEMVSKTITIRKRLPLGR
ncbi:hypothetical protein GE09DRAFT_1058533 [Coniochaeta sp. 2T2.1]|nr:hypothetical protein GE09DRAFT_1058533 [Coniochaeta sp. 2T2.1]